MQRKTKYVLFFAINWGHYTARLDIKCLENVLFVQNILHKLFNTYSILCQSSCDWGIGLLIVPIFMASLLLYFYSLFLYL